MGRYLPMDITEMILLGLPAKSLLRFKTVAKSWNNIISDSRFIQTHLQQSKNSISQDLYLCRYSRSIPFESLRLYSLLRLEDGRFQTETAWEFPGVALCTCDGVVLMRGSSNKELILWNPSLGAKTRLSYPYQYCSYFGVFHDPSNQDFKIVCIFLDDYAFYSCKAKFWTRRSLFKRIHWLKDEPGLFVGGALYWVMADRFDRAMDFLYFDSIDEEMKILRRPRVLRRRDQYFLISLRDRLCVWFNNVFESVVQIWMKEEGKSQNCWIGFMAIDNIPVPFCSFKPLYFQENKIVMHVEGERFVIYRPGERSFEEFEEEYDDEKLMIILFPYVDSLLFFPHEKRKRKSRHTCF